MIPLRDEDFSARAFNVLMSNGIKTLEDLENSSQLQLRSFVGSGPKTVREVSRFFHEKTGRHLRLVPLKRTVHGRKPKFETFVEDVPQMVPPTSEPIFIVGDAVKLRGGSPAMTIYSVHGGTQNAYDVIYFSDGIRVAERIPEAVLTYAT